MCRRKMKEKMRFQLWSRRKYQPCSVISSSHQMNSLSFYRKDKVSLVLIHDNNFSINRQGIPETRSQDSMAQILQGRVSKAGEVKQSDEEEAGCL